MESLTRSALYAAARGNRDGIAESGSSYFLTLCSVSTPVTVPEPKSASLQRFRFFFTRQHQNGRDAYWLHFGYFRTPEEAAKWREVLCRVYPAAAIHSLPQNGGRTPPDRVPEGHNLMTDSQVFSLLGRKAPEKAPSPSASRQSRQDSTLEDTLSELRESAWRSMDLNDEDTVNTTGVRHLSVKVEMKGRARHVKTARKL